MSERDLVWNVIFTPGTFRYLRRLPASLAEHTTARFRFVANGCTAEEQRSLAAAATAQIDVTVLPGTGVRTHGEALTSLFDHFDDGGYFCFVDSDVLARGPWVPFLLAALGDRVAVTSGDVAWTDDTVLPPGAEDLPGRHAIGADGFVYGSSFLALYRRGAVTHARERYGVTFEPYAHDRLDPRARGAIESLGRAFRLYDTAKVLNLLLRADGGEMTHVAHPALRHLGGISQYLSRAQSGLVVAGAGAQRLEFAGWAAALLIALTDGGEPPEPPVGIEPAIAVDVATALRACFGRSPGPDSRR